jgi:5-methylcytosine-specific restriction protein B
VKPAFLITWNPKVYAWSDFDDDVARVPFETDWCCARSKRIREGDRLWLLRQGVEPRGLVAYGVATSDWYEGPGWRRNGVPCHYVDWRVDALSPLLVPRELLPPWTGWSTMVSGIAIPEPIARKLERLTRAARSPARE